ncbi:MAG: hypothetical protein ACRD03_11100 [Acidimicrobiales bacterium]
MPTFPGAQLMNRNDLEGPRGGRGAGSYLYYRTDNVDRTSIVDHFKVHLADWSLLKDEVHRAREAATFVHGDAWFQVSAMNITASAQDVSAVPGYVVAVYADDAAALTSSK